VLERDDGLLAADLEFVEDRTGTLDFLTEGDGSGSQRQACADRVLGLGVDDGKNG